jgi:hypothetical protein
VTDQHGKVWASATRRRVRLYFDVESLFGEAVRHDVIRRPAKVARPAKFCREEWTETQERVEVVA